MEKGKRKTKKRTGKMVEFVSPYPVADCVSILNGLPADQIMEKIMVEIGPSTKGDYYFDVRRQIQSGRNKLWVAASGYLKPRDDGMTQVVIEAADFESSSMVWLFLVLPFACLFLIMNRDTNGLVTFFVVLIIVLVLAILFAHQGGRDTSRLIFLIEAVLDPD